MGTKYKLYILKELEVVNDYSNIETLDEILDLNARFYPVAEYFRIEYITFKFRRINEIT